MLSSLNACIQPEDSTQLGVGRDASGWAGIAADQRRIVLQSAWRVHNGSLWQKFGVEVATVSQQMKGIPDTQCQHMPLRASFHAATTKLPGHLDGRVNEHYLYHGVPKPVVEKILKTGINERYAGANAGTAFGDGVYLAEDAAKVDQYGGDSGDMGDMDGIESLLFGSHGGRPTPTASGQPKSLYYLFVWVVLGCHVRTEDGRTCMEPGVTVNDELWATHTYAAGACGDQLPGTSPLPLSHSRARA